MVGMSVKHDGLTKDELAQLLWKGVQLAASRSDGWADGIVAKLSDERPDMLSRVPSLEIRDYIRIALAYYGRSFQPDDWNEATRFWCEHQVAYVFGRVR